MRKTVLGIALLSMLSGCAIRRQPARLPARPLVPPPPTERLLQMAALEEPPQFPWPQEELPSFSVEIPSARPPRVRPVKPVVVRKKEAAEPAKPLVTSPVKPAPSFRLGEVLTPAQRAELSSQTESFVGSAEMSVRSASSQTLNADQQGLANQVKSLILQSRRARNLDLVESRKLAERAKTLADALMRSLGN